MLTLEVEDLKVERSRHKIQMNKCAAVVKSLQFLIEIQLWDINSLLIKPSMDSWMSCISTLYQRLMKIITRVKL